jgi:hypothetical protein
LDIFNFSVITGSISLLLEENSQCKIRWEDN